MCIRDRQDPMAAVLDAKILNDAVVGRPKQPRVRFLRRVAGCPRRERRHERRLDGIFDELEVLCADSAHEHGHEPTVVVPEAMLDQLVRGGGVAHGPMISRTSQLEPGLIKPGHPLSLIHISEPTRLLSISYAVFCLKK